MRGTHDVSRKHARMNLNQLDDSDVRGTVSERKVGETRQPENGEPSEKKGNPKVKSPSRMKIYELDENDITGNASDFNYSEWKKRIEEESRREDEGKAHRGQEKVKKVSKQSGGGSLRRSSTSATEKLEGKATRADAVTGTPKPRQPAPVSSVRETVSKKTKESSKQKSMNNEWGTHKILREGSDIEKKTRHEFTQLRQFKSLGFAFFSRQKHNDMEIRMLAFEPEKTTYSENLADFQNKKMVMYTSKEGNGLFLIKLKKTDEDESREWPVIPEIEPKVLCKTSVVFNKDKYRVEEARLDTRKLNEGKYPLECITERHKVLL